MNWVRSWLARRKLLHDAVVESLPKYAHIEGKSQGRPTHGVQIHGLKGELLFDSTADNLSEHYTIPPVPGLAHMDQFTIQVYNEDGERKDITFTIDPDYYDTKEGKADGT